jgi:hypothetical protein
MHDWRWSAQCFALARSCSADARRPSPIAIADFASASHRRVAPLIHISGG